jgi:diguanylate cyclase (GGDEF)-like protein
MDRRRAFEAHRKAMVERASATARIGIWSCSLPDETLHWTEGIYDLFELPRGAPIDRQQTLRMYVPESARQMQALRSEAIATLGDFNFDAEIITAKGNRRWMRITATVDGVDGKARRIFGMKQNITEEKLMAEETRRLAETDTLTGLANRATFNSRLQALRQCPAGALVLIDLDNFKSINDTLGHAAGDACLVETGRRLRQCVPHGGVVARLGGDEFAIVVDRAERADLSALSDGILRAFDRPFKLGGTQRQVGVSLGLARAVGQDAETLYRNADTALYAAKSAGRGVWRLYQAA